VPGIPGPGQGPLKLEPEWFPIEIAGTFKVACAQEVYRVPVALSFLKRGGKSLACFSLP